MNNSPLNKQASQIDIAVGAYDRTAALLDGSVQVEGFNTHFISGDLEEIFANRFAAAVLMPKNLIELELHRMKSFGDHFEDSLKKLAKKFEVSETAMRFRLLNI
jgi:Zn-dependent peptidase ImmA (M78 family)